MKKLFIRLTSLLITTVTLPEWFRDLFMWPLATRVLGPDYAAPINLKAGFPLNAYLGDQLGRLALFYGSYLRYFWEPSTTQLLEKIVPGTQSVIIAGSHIGLTVLYARKAMGTAGTVHTFEPIPHLFELSQRNFKQNSELGKILLNKTALGNTPGDVIMTIDRIRSRIVTTTVNGKNIPTTIVPITTIDAYCAERRITSIDVLFLDVEGYEYNVLRGMSRILAQTPPRDIIYEISFPYKDNLRAATTIEEYLSTFGYTFYIIEDAYDPTYYSSTIPLVSVTPATPSSYKQHQHLRYFNMYATLRPKDEVSTIAQITTGT